MLQLNVVFKSTLFKTKFQHSTFKIKKKSNRIQLKWVDTTFALVLDDLNQFVPELYFQLRV